MSRAFVREEDQVAVTLPDRAISAHPNFVTASGRAQLEARLRALEAELSAARSAGDKELAARIARDQRYFVARRASAQLVESALAPDVVRFGVQVTLELADGSRRELRLVGEDEADPAAGLISWVSPIAQTLLGLQVGDDVTFAGQTARIVALAP